MRAERIPAWSGLCLIALALSAVGCVRGCTSSYPPIHLNPNMDYQLKYQAQEESRFFYDGVAMRLPVPGTVARGELREDLGFYTGRDADDTYVTSNPLPAADETLARGANRYTIYCQPCHDKRGTGKGILAERGVPTATFHDEIRLAYPDGQIFEVISQGVGLMKGYAYPIAPRDRWAIVAHVNRLQQDRQAAGLTPGVSD